MKRIVLSISLIMISLVTFGASEKDYDALWKQVNEKIQKDLPRDAIAILKQISKKAEKEGQYGHLLAAELQQIQQMGNVSPDSIEPGINRLKEKAKQAETSANSSSLSNQNAAVLYAVLGGISHESISEKDKKEYFDKALQHPEILKTIPATVYNPLTEKQNDNEFKLTNVKETLLDAISHEAKRHQWLSDYYEKEGNRINACIELYYSLKNDPLKNSEDYAETKKLREKILNGIGKYGDLEVSMLLNLHYYNTLVDDKDISQETRYEYLDSCIQRWPKSQVAKRFMRYQQDITAPTFNVTLHGQDFVLPNKETKLYITNITNVLKIDFTITPIKADGTLEYGGTLSKDSDIEKYRKLAISNAKKIALSTPLYSHPIYETHIDSIVLPKLSTGVYLVEASTTDASMHRAVILFVSDLRILSLKHSDKEVRLVSVSATTGKPVPNATIRLSEDGWKNGKRQIIHTKDITTDSKGEALFNTTEFNPDIIYAFTSSDKAMMKQNFYNSFNTWTHHEQKNYINIFTDRSIYRPGQKVQGTVIVHNNYDIYNIHSVEGQKLKIEVLDNDYEDIYTDSIITDKNGHAAFSFDIPTGHKNGSWDIRIKGENCITVGNNIKVEEYKRPTFEIIAPKIDKPYYVDTKEKAETKKVDIDFTAKTFSGVPVQNAKVTYSINRQQTWWCWWCEASGSKTFAEDIETTTDADGKVKIPLELILPERTSGRYHFNVSVKITDKSGETHEETIRVPVYSSDLEKAEEKVLKPEEREEFFEVSGDAFPPDGNMTFRMGSTEKDVKAYYSLISEKGVVEAGSVDFSHQILSRTFKYKEAYGEGLTLIYVWMKNGKAHSFQKTILKPQPDLKLKTRWITFRDKTQPGSQEKWTLKIENLNSKSVNSGAFTIYDKSLDQIVSHHWALNVLRGYGYNLHSNWSATHSNSISFSSYANIKRLGMGTLPEPSAFNHTYYPYYGVYYFDMGFRGRRNARPMMLKASAVACDDTGPLMDIGVTESAAFESKSEAFSEVAVLDKKKEEAQKPASQSLKGLVRTNFNETAFFAPNLIADKDGNISLEFTLPEAMTSWRLLGLVHDGQMRNTFLDSTCVAQKDIMVQPNMPRFVREGDNATIASKISNTTDKEIKAKAMMQILIPGTETVISEQTQEITLAPKGQQSVSFNLDTKALKLPESGEQATAVVIRIAAISDSSSDGEQHDLDILPASEQVTNTVPLTFFEPGTYKTNADSLWLAGATNKTLVCEYTDNPAWLMVESLPTLSKTSSRDAVSTMAAIYASSIAQAIKENVKDANEAYAKSLENDTASVESLASNIAHLRELQLSDGSWPWWEGMNGSYYITTAVAQMIARQKLILGGTVDDLEDMLNSALSYMNKKAEEEAKELKKLEKKGYKNLHPSETTTDYLYITSILSSTKKSSGITYLISLMEKIPAEFTILGKARAAVIFSAYGKTKKAKEYLESIRQYSVYTPLAGRYYDTRKAYYSWRNYRIPTEVAAIEALSMVAPEDTKTICEMQQWLLHEKRTTQWDTPINTVDAIYAFLRPTTHYGTSKSSNAINTKDTKMAFVKAFSSAKNYRRDTLDVKTTHEVTITKSTTGTSWGAVYASQYAPLSSIDNASSGITVQREVVYEKTRDESQEARELPSENWGVGSKVKVKITIVADRDYDFVTVTDNRPACLEPVESLSTYQWGYYEEIKDRSTRYHFNNLSKGKHVIETEYYIDRTGDYLSGTCTAICAFAPEFTGRATSTSLIVK